MLRTCLALFVVATVTVEPTTALAWNAAGHKTVAEIAWRKLDPQTRTAVAQAIRLHPRFDEDFAPQMESDLGDQGAPAEDHWIFCHAAIWPDIARDQPEFHRGFWHFINLPVFTSDDEAAAFAGQLPVNVSFDPATTAHETDYNGVQALKVSLGLLASPTTSDQVRAVRLCWVLHLIPDLAQPLHSAALFSAEVFPKGDKGGNKVSIRRAGTTGHGKALHGVWDSLLGTDQKFSAIQGKAESLIQAHPADFVASFVALPFDAWTTETQQVAAAVAYEPLLDAVHEAEASGEHLETIDVPESYFSDSGEVAGRHSRDRRSSSGGHPPAGRSQRRAAAAFCTGGIGIPGRGGAAISAACVPALYDNVRGRGAGSWRSSGTGGHA